MPRMLRVERTHLPISHSPKGSLQRDVTTWVRKPALHKGELLVHSHLMNFGSITSGTLLSPCEASMGREYCLLYPQVAEKVKSFGVDHWSPPNQLSKKVCLFF